MIKITLLKTLRNQETLRTTSIATLAESIKGGEYLEEVNALRTNYPLLTLDGGKEGKLLLENKYVQAVPRICFSSELENRNRQRVNKGYTGLVLLEVNNLQSYEEAAAVRQGAGQMPQTLLAFVGVSGRSVKIVCQGVLVSTEKVPTDFEEVGRFHVALYEKARMAYNAQLGVTIEKLEPQLERTCYMSADSGMVYNMRAIPFYIDLSTTLQTVSPSTTEPEETAPGLDRYLSLHHIFEFNLAKAFDELSTYDDDLSDDEEGYTHLLTQRLADYCCETGIPMGVALNMTEQRRPFRHYLQLVRLTFENAYRRDGERKYRSKKTNARPLKYIPVEALLSMKIDLFLKGNYELRMNIMRGVAEYRQRTALGFDFQDLTEQARNSMTLRAMEQGIKCWDKDIRRYVNSDDIEQYDPMNDFLEHLPQWDGKDRVTPLALRIHTTYKEWPRLFHIWMLSMVAMWQGKGQLTGNALVPLLIGRQGCGKTSFCRILLPRDQREYYNDRINFKNENDLNLGLTSFALINLDEFDQVTQRQQIVLKYLVSTSDLKYRPPYGKAYTQHRRFASFIGTTNEQAPLTDPSGNRRFVCVQVDGNIDFQTPVDYPQLYAQLYHEVASGERYWLTKEEEQALMDHNRQFQQVSGLGEMLLSLYRKPGDGEEGQWTTLRAMASRMKKVFRSGFSEDPATIRKISAFLNRPEYKFKRRRIGTGIEYCVVEVE